MSSPETHPSLVTSSKPAGRARSWLLAVALLVGLAPGVVALAAPSYALTTGPTVTAWSDQIVLSHSGTSVTMQYSGVENAEELDVARFSCSLDGQAKDCSGPSLALTNLADNATHTFSIRGYDSAGHAGPLCILKWIVGQIPPDTNIVLAPANGEVTGPSVQFVWSSPSASTTSFLCSLDGVELGPDVCAYGWGRPGQFAVAWDFCFSAREDGQHTFKVAAVDADGRVDPTPESRTWIVDHTSPNSTGGC